MAIVDRIRETFCNTFKKAILPISQSSLLPHFLKSHEHSLGMEEPL